MSVLERPQPRPGVLKIQAYVPGKSTAPGVAKVFKLSSNETPLGASPKALAAYNAVGAHLHDYPDGAATELREAIGRTYGLDPSRIVCGAGSDDLLNLLARAYLQDGDEAIHTTHGFLVYPIVTLGAGATPVVAPEKEYTADVDAILARVTPRTKIVFLANPNNPTGTYIPFDEVKRLHAGLPKHVLFVIDAAYAEYVKRNDYESGIELVATSENVVMTRTFSKIYGLAALRLGWLYGPAHVVDAVNRIRGPFNVNAPSIAAGVAAITDVGHVERSREHNEKWLAWLTDEIRKLGLDRHAERRQLHPDPFPRDQGQDREGCRRAAHLARIGDARGRRLSPAERAAHERRHRGGEPRRGRGARRADGEEGVSPIIDRLALIGVGLIGGSIARAAREYGVVREIVATARSETTRRRVVELGIADQVVETNAEAAKDADLVIVCIPVGASGPVAAEIAGSLKPGAIVSDVGSVKGQVLKDMAPHIPKGVHLIPAHPVAGTENSGPDSGFSELFVNRWCILTPPEGADAAAVEKLKAFWSALGANVEVMTAEHHDMVLAITSHLPHLIAYTIVGTAEEFSTVSRSEVLKFSAGGFRDFTRIAASDPTMWRDVFLHNKEAVLEMLAQFSEDLAKLTRAMRRGDGDTLFDHFSRTRAIRRGIVQIGQDSAAPDFGRAHPGKGRRRRSQGRMRRIVSNL